MCPLPENLKYAQTHEWVYIDENGIAIVGITDFAQESLGDLINIRHADLNIETTQGSVVMSVESVKSSSDIFAPLSGKIVAINEALEDEPELVNDEPYDSGWLFKIMPNDLKELDNLISAEEYAESTVQ